MFTPKKIKVSIQSICITIILTIDNLACFCGFLNIMNCDLAEISDPLFTFSYLNITNITSINISVPVFTNFFGHCFFPILLINWKI